MCKILGPPLRGQRSAESTAVMRPDGDMMESKLRGRRDQDGNVK